ncbi:MAG: LysR family transcriptional regulator [Ilumatobacter sp.]|nr:LysR family transcriptional regulator [Ilumatobacter sp.]
MWSTDIEIRHLAAFLAVCEHRSFGHAARALGYSQAAVSQQIAGLERTVGTALFDRPGGPRPVDLTDAGRQLLPYAESVFRQLNEAEEALAEVAAGARGRLAIGSFESVSVAILPRIVALLTAERPNLELALTEHDNAEVLLKMVDEGELDATFLPNGDVLAGFEQRRLMTDPFVAVVPADHAGDVVTMRELGDSPLVGHGDGDSCQARVNASILAHGRSPRYVFRSSDNAALQAMVRSGLGIAVMPLLAVETGDDGVAVLPIDPPIPPREVTLAWRSRATVPPALERFVELAEQVCDELTVAQAV